MADIVQVALRGSRKEFFLNSRNIWLGLRDRVIVQGEHGESIGRGSPGWRDAGGRNGVQRHAGQAH